MLIEGGWLGLIKEEAGHLGNVLSFLSSPSLSAYQGVCLECRL